MAKVPNGVETLPKISIAWVGCTNVTDRQTTDDRHADRRTGDSIGLQATAFMFAKNGGTAAKNRVERSGVKRRACLTENDGAGAKRGAGSSGTRKERWAGWIGRSQPAST